MRFYFVIICIINDKIKGKFLFVCFVCFYMNLFLMGFFFLNFKFLFVFLMKLCWWYFDVFFEDFREDVVNIFFVFYYFYFIFIMKKIYLIIF